MDGQTGLSGDLPPLDGTSPLTQWPGSANCPGSPSYRICQAPFDADLAGIEATLRWFRNRSFKHTVNPLRLAECQTLVRPPPVPSKGSFDTCRTNGRSARIEWVKGHSGVPGNALAGALTGKAASRISYGPTSIAYFKSRISETFRDGKEKWTN